MEVHFNMAQTQRQFELPLLRIGSIAFLAGVVVVIVSTMLHPSREDPANHSLMFMEYANSDSCSYRTICRRNSSFGRGFGVLHSLLVRSESSTTYTLSWIGFAVAIMT